MDRTQGKTAATRKRGRDADSTAAAPEAGKEAEEREAPAAAASAPVEGTPKKRKPRHKKQKRDLQLQSPYAVSDVTAVVTDTDLANKSNAIVSPRSGHDPKCPNVETAHDLVAEKEAEEHEAPAPAVSAPVEGTPKKRKPKHKKQKRDLQLQSHSAVSDVTSVVTDTDLANKSNAIVSPSSGHDPKCPNVETAHDMTEEREAPAPAASAPVEGTPKKRKPKHKKQKRDLQLQSPSATSDVTAVVKDTDLANKSNAIVSPSSGHDPKCPDVETAHDATEESKAPAPATSAPVEGTPKKRRKPKHKKQKRDLQLQSPSATSDVTAVVKDTDLANKSNAIVSPSSGHDPKCPDVETAHDSVVGKVRNKDNNSQICSSLNETSAERKRRKRKEKRRRKGKDIDRSTVQNPSLQLGAGEVGKKNTDRSTVQNPSLQPGAGEVGKNNTDRSTVQNTSLQLGAGEVVLATIAVGDITPGSEHKKSKKRWKKNHTGFTEAPLLQSTDLGETASIGMMDGQVQPAFSEVEATKYSDNVRSCICASEKGAANSVSLTLVQGVRCNTVSKDDCQHARSDRSDVLSDLGHAHKKEVRHIYSPRGSLIRFRRKKLLILDLNGLLADINQDHHNAHMSHAKVRGKLVFKRPYYDDFLRFCFQNFELGIWSSRLKANVDAVVNILMKDLKKYLLFCWDMSKCTATGCKTLENKQKPLVLKELKKLWNKEDPDLPWEEGEFSPSNTLLVDDSPYKALANPPYTAIFPQPYSYRNRKDDSLGPGGDLRVYLENLATADDVQCYVQEHPFGQPSITRSDKDWNFYVKILDNLEKPFD